MKKGERTFSYVEMLLKEWTDAKLFTLEEVQKYEQNKPWSGDLGQRNRFADSYTTRSRLALTVDTRTATEYGVVRTFGQGDFTFDTLGSNTFNPQSINATSPVGGTQLLMTAGGGYVAVEFVFIQFAGFTFGKSASAYATPWHGYPGNNSSFLSAVMTPSPA